MSNTPLEIVKVVQEFLEPVTTKPLTEFGMILSDSVREFRLKNQLRIFGNVKKLANENNITLKQIKTKVMFDLLEGIGDVDEEEDKDSTLEDMWTNLFINYIDSKSNLKLTVYPSILKQLSSREVQYLKKASEPSERRPSWGRNRIEFKHGDNSFELNNLERLGLMEADNTYKYENRGFFDGEQQDVDVSFTGYMSITAFGIDFIEACTLKEQ